MRGLDAVSRVRRTCGCVAMPADRQAMPRPGPTPEGQERPCQPHAGVDQIVEGGGAARAPHFPAVSSVATDHASRLAQAGPAS